MCLQRDVKTRAGGVVVVVEMAIVMYVRDITGYRVDDDDENIMFESLAIDVQ